MYSNIFHYINCIYVITCNIICYVYIVNIGATKCIIILCALLNFFTDRRAQKSPKTLYSPNETFILFLWKLSHNILFKRNNIEMGQLVKFQKHSKEWVSLCF